MRFDAKKPFDKQKAKAKFEYLINNGKVFDLTEKFPKRSIDQNSYVHLLFSWYSLETGMPKDYVKQVVFKQLINPDTFKEDAVNKITGECVTVYRSSSKLDTKEMTECIRRFRDHALIDLGIYLPEPDDMALLNDMETQIENQKHLIP